MSSKLRLDVRHLNRWRRHGERLRGKRQAWCLSALKWFVYHARRYTSALLYLYLFTFYFLFCTVSKLWPIIGQIFTIDMGVLITLTPSPGVIPYEYPDKLYIFKN